MERREPGTASVTVVGPASLFLDTLAKALRRSGLVAELVPSLDGCRPHGVVIADACLPLEDLASVVHTVRTAGRQARILLLLDRPDPAGRRVAASLLVDGWFTRQEPLARVVDAVSACTRSAGSRTLPADPTVTVRGAAPPVTLTAREVEILTVVAGGLSDIATAERLRISVHTVRSHLRSARVKLGAANRFAAVASARSCGALDVSSTGPW